MKKIFDFIIDKRKYVFSVMLGLCLVCCLLIPKIKINTDLTKYLPDDFSMSQGMDVMAEEFPDTKVPSTIRVMFKGLSDAEKSEVKTKLQNIEYVDGVTYDPVKNEKDGYSLFTVSTSYAYSTNEEMAIEADIQREFSSYDMAMENDDVMGANLPLWVILLAFGLLMVVLLIMCSSWFEPVLFLATIGVAVGLNMGTNIIFPDISHMTFSICSIMQVVLSMDYSIIIMNRYRQEKLTAPDKYTAMKIALKNAFPSVVSSGMTTVIGLLMLLFMSFTIGKDIGLVLAKGVIISMICVFTVLPVLILMFDKILEKSRKKDVHIPFGKVAKFGYKARKVIAVVFVLLFIGTYFLQNITEITYSISNEDEIAEVFPVSNPVVMIYDNKDEDKVAVISDKLSSHEKVNSVLGYTTTLGKSFTTDEMVSMIDNLGANFGVDMGGGLNIDSSLLSVLYYDKLGDETERKLTVSQVLSFIESNVLTNEMFSSFIDDSMKENMNLISDFSSKENLTKPMTSKEMADLFSMGEDDIEKIFTLYMATETNVDAGRMKLTSFADFIVNDIAQNEMYASFFDEDMKSKIGLVSDFTDVNVITKPMSAKELSDKLGIDESDVKLLYAYYYSSLDSYNPPSLSVKELIDFIANDIANNPMMSSQLDKETLDLVRRLGNIPSALMPKGKVSYHDMANLLGYDESMIKLVYSVHDFNKNSPDKKLSLQTVVNFLAENKEMVSSLMDKDQLALIEMGQGFINGAVSGKEFTTKEIADLVGIEESLLRQLFMLYKAEYGDTSSWAVSVENFVDFIISDIVTNKDFESFIPDDAKSLLTTADTIIEAVVSEKEYSSDELASMLGSFSDKLDGNTMSLLYLYYSAVNFSDKTWTLTIEEMFDHLNNNMINDPRLATLIDGEMKAQIRGAKTQLNDGVKMMRGKNHSLMMIDTSLALEGAETTAFIEDLVKDCDSSLSGKYYLVGNSPMSYEMQQIFDRELLTITLLTAIAIFLVVAITFRSIPIPLILVLLVQCGVYITVSVSGFLGYSVYYLALLVVQCILMGATIDYGILFTNYYRESRATMSVKDSIKVAYDGSTHTIFTSGLIMVFVTAVIGFSPVDPTIAQLCQTISIGAASAILLILFVLPGLLAAFDRFTAKPKKKRDHKEKETAAK